MDGLIVASILIVPILASAIFCAVSFVIDLWLDDRYPVEYKAIVTIYFGLLVVIVVYEFIRLVVESGAL